VGGIQAEIEEKCELGRLGKEEKERDILERMRSIYASETHRWPHMRERVTSTMVSRIIEWVSTISASKAGFLHSGKCGQIIHS
jgi:hypothetical protein